jgi:pyruvate dehydrogenase E1 component beta subunit
MVRIARQAVEKEGLDVEIIDLLTLWPWDRQTVLDSVRKTGRLVTVEEATASSGWGADVVATVASEAFAALKAPPLRITLPDAPVPYNGDLEARFLPSPEYVAEQTASLISDNRAPAPWWRKAS